MYYVKSSSLGTRLKLQPSGPANLRFKFILSVKEGPEQNYSYKLGRN